MNAKQLKQRVEEAILPEDPNTPLDEFQAAKFLNVSVYWLRAARKNGVGPAWGKLGGQVRYSREALLFFIQTISPTK